MTSRRGAGVRRRRWLAPAAGLATVLAAGLAPGVAGAAPVARDLVAGSIVEVRVTDFGVPLSAEAVVLNVTATDTVRPGFVTAFSCDDDRPGTSNLNYGVGDSVAGAVIAEVAADGSVCLFTYAGADVVVDISGYFPAGSDYTAVEPQRLVDTRPGAPLAAGGELVVPVTNRAGIPATATAVAVTITATEPQAAGYLTAYPCGEAAPLASNVNYLAGEDAPNLAIAKVGTGGAVCITSYATSDVVVDVFGWLGAGGYTPLTPGRLVDTRQSTPLGAGGVLAVPVPAGTSAAVLNVTASDPQAAGYLTAYPCGEAVPLASNVNYVTGQTVPNLAITKVGAGSAVCVYSFVTTDVVVDLFGTFTGTGGYVALSPVRALDTRDTLPVLDEFGIGPLSLGQPIGEAFATGAVHPPLYVGCPIFPEPVDAALAPPLDGFVTTGSGFLDTIVVFEGAVLPGGYGPGDDLGLLADALVDEGYDVFIDDGYFLELFGVLLLQAEVDGVVALEATADPDTGEVLAIAAPFIPTCE